ncbi:hypothetical protein NDQ71_02800 [Pseudoalteromonas sp. KG3]|uniref:hypothetical protein n=1 Tax=Pseudoalteromonas sp. KG3 TaxID=2951137 RepID=UPI0026586E31|nr:hypothetical protein [Pseudoalteromonas sp. KG3]WKD24039.1 hypothetical protein NDQ71_02800 [Pseudoalteromonas sp. KG3]
MTNQVKILHLETALGSKTRIDLTNKNVGSDGGLFAYFDTLAFNDECEFVSCVKKGEPCAHFQILPQEYLKLKNEAKALNLIT